MNVTETIPASLQAATDAALAWVNETQGASFEVTGLVDADRALAARPGTPLELGLVLCDGDVCVREQVTVLETADGLSVSSGQAAAPDIPAHLDPPAGVRGGWLDAQLAAHAFVVLVFYRGFW